MTIGIICGGGVTGTFLTAVFALPSFLAEAGMTRIQFMRVQLDGIACVGVYTAILAFIIFKGLSLTIGLRTDTKDEEIGMHISEHGMSAYADS